MTAALLFPVLAACLYYLGYWANITKEIWSRYPPGFAAFMGCAACSGFWYGAALPCTVGRLLDWNYLGIPWYHPLATLLSGMVAIVTTPLLAVWHLRALDALHPFSGKEPDGEEPKEP